MQTYQPKVMHNFHLRHLNRPTACMCTNICCGVKLTASSVAEYLRFTALQPCNVQRQPTAKF